MPTIFNRNPSESELLRLQLTLSAYQDGRGMNFEKSRRSYVPGWRDFERAFADIFSGIYLESKHIFDILIPARKKQGVFSGISCKMSKLPDGRKLETYPQARMELSNANAQFWKELNLHKITVQNWTSQEQKVAYILLNLIHRWHMEALARLKGILGILDNKVIDCDKFVTEISLDNSIYVTLSYDDYGNYQIHAFSLSLPRTEELTWSHSEKNIQGRDAKGNLIIEWYGLSGGQLKYYPFFRDAIWSSSIFKLQQVEKIIKPSEFAYIYFPDIWPK